MADCKYTETCPFFLGRMQNMPATAGMFVERYCRKDGVDCARLIVLQKLGRENVPTDLFPNQLDRAEQLTKK